MFGRLLKSLYGTPDAATNWSKAYTDVVINIGFDVGVSNPCLFKHAARGTCTVVHGDDFLSSGSDASLIWMKADLAKQLEIKTQLPSEKPGESQITL